VLVQGGAGGTGSIIVQIAKAKGAYVIATASARNHPYLREIGADEVIDYRTTRFEDVVRNVDVVVDTVGGEAAALVTTSQATHVGDMFGYPGSRRRFTLTTVLMLRFSGGRIASETRLYDFTGLLVQLGVLKASGPAVAAGGDNRVA